MGKVQSPINITNAVAVPLPSVNFGYQPVELHIFNDCNHYRVQVLFPTNEWLRIGDVRKYPLTEFHFHEPGEHEVNGHRAAMVIHLVHRSPTFGAVAIEIPVEVGAANPTIQKVLDHVPAPGDQQVVPGVTINEPAK